MERRIVVAIDGTAGSGKSTTAMQAAKKLGFLYLETGAMYRAITLKVIREDIDIDAEKELQALLESTVISFDSSRIYLDSEDVSEAIGSHEVDAMVSEVSAIPIVRKKLVALQREMADKKSVICEGRDIGSVVFPDADLKIFMDARNDIRAQRRLRQMSEKGAVTDIDSVRTNIAFRDRFDSSRECSPLRKVENAILLDTTNLTIEEEVDFVVRRVRELQCQK